MFHKKVESLFYLDAGYYMFWLFAFFHRWHKALDLNKSLWDLSTPRHTINNMPWTELSTTLIIGNLGFTSPSGHSCNLDKRACLKNHAHPHDFGCPIHMDHCHANIWNTPMGWIVTDIIVRMCQFLHCPNLAL